MTASSEELSIRVAICNTALSEVRLPVPSHPNIVLRDVDAVIVTVVPGVARLERATIVSKADLENARKNLVLMRPANVRTAVALAAAAKTAAFAPGSVTVGHLASESNVQPAVPPLQWGQTAMQKDARHASVSASSRPP